MFGEVTALDARAEIVRPSQPATLAAPQQTCMVTIYITAEIRGKNCLSQIYLVKPKNSWNLQIDWKKPHCKDKKNQKFYSKKLKKKPKKKNSAWLTAVDLYYMYHLMTIPTHTIEPPHKNLIRKMGRKKNQRVTKKKGCTGVCWNRSPVAGAVLLNVRD